MKPLFVAWSTTDPYYSGHARRLKKSLDLFGLANWIVFKKSPGSWADCCFHKAHFILEALETWDRDIVYIDADGEVMQYPELLESIETDLALVENAEGRGIASMIYFRNSERSRTFVREWIGRNEMFPNNPEADQENFGYLARAASNLTTILPASYNFEIGITKLIHEPIVIRQHIASKLGIVPGFQSCHELLQTRLRESNVDYIQ